MSRAALRESARLWRTHDLGLPVDEPIAASTIVDACAKATGYAIAQLGSGDPLLSGALGVLDRDARSVWIDNSLAPEHRFAVLAHEFAHLALHSACSPDDFTSSADFERSDEDAFDAVAGYSPKQRREVDANIWASELLIPEPMLRRAFYGGAVGATELAGMLGLDSTLVRAQMAAVLLRLAHRDTSKEPAAQPSEAEPGLDESQAKAAGVERGPFLLAAGPGTGKTRTLVARCVDLVSRKGVAPESILALTFSRKAAAEMRERLIAAGVGAVSSGPWVGTFHSFCLETLRRHGDAVGLRAGWRIAGETEAFGMLERRLPELRLRELSELFNPSRHIRDILKSISRAKDELCPPERFAELVRAHAAECAAEPASDEALRLIEIARVYTAYQQIMTESNRLDYGDLIVKTVDLLESNPVVARSLQSQYPQIVADEYQDVNYASARLLRLLSGVEAAGLWAVGDRLQSIYRFRGASPANVAQFDKDYPGGRRSALDVNYRSKPKIVRLVTSAAERLSAAQPGVFRGWKSRRLDDDGAACIRLAVSDTAESQAFGMAGEIRRLREGGLAFADIVVLVRSHSQAIKLAGHLLGEGIPVLYVGDLIERPEVKDLLCLLDLFAAREGAGAALLRRAAALCGGLNDLNALLKWARQIEPDGRSLADRILADKDICAAEPRLAKLLAETGVDRDPGAIVARFLFDRPDYLRNIDADTSGKPMDGAMRLLAIRRLLEIVDEHRRIFAREFGAAGDSDSRGAIIDAVSWFMREIRRYGAAGERITATGDAEDGIDAVRIMTVHAAKGLEFPAVFLPNLTEGSFPLRDRAPFIAEPNGLTGDRLMGDVDQEEEACLFFVALSRARDHLILSRAETAGAGGRLAKPSSFLTLIGEALDELGVKAVQWRSPAREAAGPTNEPVGFLPARNPKPRFSASSLELYRHCPRQYFYRKEQGLTGAERSGDAERYRECLRTINAWMQDEWRSGRLPDQAQVTRRTTEFWTEPGVPMELYRQLALERAQEVVLQTRALYAARAGSETPAPDQVLAAELSNCVIHVSADLISVGRDGGVRVVRQLDGKTGTDDHTHPRLSLLRTGMSEAFKGRAGEVELSYSRTGEVRSAPLRAQFEPGRLAKYEQAADGILRGRFDPAPADPGQCATCPFHFICPE
jgi:DNA helicase II / ATP-dependent DNA helicase PcrA